MSCEDQLSGFPPAGDIFLFVFVFVFDVGTFLAEHDT
jgi:hypothetical protein